MYIAQETEILLGNMKLISHTALELYVPNTEAYHCIHLASHQSHTRWMVVLGPITEMVECTLKKNKELRGRPFITVPKYTICKTNVYSYGIMLFKEAFSEMTENFVRWLDGTGGGGHPMLVPGQAPNRWVRCPFNIGVVYMVTGGAILGKCFYFSHPRDNCGTVWRKSNQQCTSRSILKIGWQSHGRWPLCQLKDIPKVLLGPSANQHWGNNQAPEQLFMPIMSS